jgi:membrane protease YdiL (CAAX protease family)
LPPSACARDTAGNQELAPAWHTAALVFVIAGVALTGTLLSSYKNAPPVAVVNSGRLIVAVYLPSIAVNGGLAAYVCRVGRGRSFFAELTGKRWTSFTRAGLDLILACAGWLLIELAEIAAARLFGPPSAATRALLPATQIERLAWCAFALSAGFCEEIVYRGYIQTQLGARTTPSMGILLQAVLFGWAHAAQGGWAALRLGVYGLGLGLLAKWRGSLVPGILCHVGVDLASGLWLQ